MESATGKGKGGTSVPNDSGVGAKAKALGNDGERNTKRQKLNPTNEFIQNEVHEIFLEGSGEDGIANKIVGYLQDHFRLDSLKRVNESTCAGEMCNELQKLIDAGVADEAYVADVLNALWRVMLEEQEESDWLIKCRNLVRANGMHAVLFCMTKCPKNRILQERGIAILLSVGEYRREVGGEEKETICSFIHSEPFARALVGVAIMHEDDTELIEDALTALVIGVYEADSEMKASYRVLLKRLNVMPLCYGLLQKESAPINSVKVATMVLATFDAASIMDFGGRTPTFQETMGRAMGTAFNNGEVELGMLASILRLRARGEF